MFESKRKELTFEILIENVQDANYTWTEEPMGPCFEYHYYIMGGIYDPKIRDWDMKKIYEHRWAR